jgi:hypothetical protein
MKPQHQADLPFPFFTHTHTHTYTHTFRYAQLCAQLANPKDETRAILTAFEYPSQGRKPVDFRRLVLNKCQEEFEKGISSDASVAVREEEEHPGEEEVRGKGRGGRGM